MRKVIFALIFLMLITGCDITEAVLVEAETAQIEAETSRAEVVADANEHDGLVSLVNRLLDELKDERQNADTGTRETIDALVAVIQDFADNQKPQTRWDLVVLAVIAVAVLLWRDLKKPTVVIMPQLGDGIYPRLAHDRRWQMSTPQVVDIERGTKANAPESPFARE